MGEQQKSGELRGTVARVVQIVRHLAEGPEDWALADLADALGLPRSTTHRLLQLLQSQGSRYIRHVAFIIYSLNIIFPIAGFLLGKSIFRLSV